MAIIILEDIKIALKEKSELTFEQLKERLPLKIKDIVALFSKQKSKKLAFYYLSINYYIKLY